MPTETTGNSKTLQFDEKEALERYKYLYTILNVFQIPYDKLSFCTLIFIGTEELRKAGIPMDAILEAISDVEQFKEKAN